MKALVMPLIDAQNYGSILQAFATQKKLEELADCVEIINYVWNSRFSNILKSQINPVRLLDAIISYFFYKKNYEDFALQHLNMSDVHVYSSEDFASCEFVADIYCAGSDQIWNPQHFRALKNNESFLSFVPDNKLKFSYSSSFGKDSLNEDEIECFKKYIKKFNYISVREDTGVGMLDKCFGLHKAVQLVDPTLAMPPDFWRQYATEIKISYKYILVYNMKMTYEFERYAGELSKKTGLPLVRLCNHAAQMVCRGKRLLLPPVFDFITLVDNAEYVLTDSFHGAAFSMNLNTEPIIICQSLSSRLTSLLRLLNEEQRIVRDANDFGVLNRHVDWNHVNMILARERGRVDTYLKDVFSSEVINERSN